MEGCNGIVEGGGVEGRNGACMEDILFFFPFLCFTEKSQPQRGFVLYLLLLKALTER